MKIFNQDKTKELNETELDFSLGHLVDDKIVSAHHEATEAIPAKSIAQQVAEHSAAGREILVKDGKTYYISKSYANGGKNAVRIEDLPAQPAKAAYDDYEDIKVYVPYTAEELKKIADGKRHAELKAELAKIKEDIEQEAFGIIRDDYKQKKARAAEIINELRTIEGKDTREALQTVESRQELVEKLDSVKSTNEAIAAEYNKAIGVVNDLSERVSALESNYDPTVIK